MANKLTQAQERKLERQKQEIDNRKEIVKGLKEARDVGIELTDIQKNILETATRENIIRQSTSSLETKLTDLILYDESKEEIVNFLSIDLKQEDFDPCKVSRKLDLDS